MSVDAKGQDSAITTVRLPDRNVRHVWYRLLRGNLGYSYARDRGGVVYVTGRFH